MKNKNVLVYGANGYTGQLIVAALQRHGCNPILAGRDKVKLAELAGRTNLLWRSFDLEEAATELADVSLVINAAGPFAHTARPLASAALQRGCHYLDIGNEPAGLQAIYELDTQALAQGLILLPGIGFGTSASNCLLHQLLPRVQHPVEATIFLAPHVNQRGSATRHTMLQGIREGCCEVHNGHLVRCSGWQAIRYRQLPFGKLTLVAAPLGDAVAAFRSSAIPKITACIGVPLPPLVAGIALELGRRLLSIDPIYRHLTAKQSNPTSPVGSNKPGKSRAWVSVRDSDGVEHESWMETGEGYAFTAESVAQATMHVLDGSVKARGALTPAMAFGGDWLNSIPGTVIHGPEDSRYTEIKP